MKIGLLVVIVSTTDKRVIEKQKVGLVIGTLIQVLCDDQVMVLLDNGDLWVGLTREIRLSKEQDNG